MALFSALPTALTSPSTKTRTLFTNSSHTILLACCKHDNKQVHHSSPSTVYSS
uniref:Uncharacterized protein n=1 Tax=Arundo donax TaxID=35708 RepID=A0A0A8ZUG2_ARUDO